MRIPEITVSPSPDGHGYVLSRGAVRLGCLFEAAGGWVTISSGRRAKPLPTAAEAAGRRWGADARGAVQSRETSEAA